jgi:hypothetical protein
VENDSANFHEVREMAKSKVSADQRSYAKAVFALLPLTLALLLSTACRNPSAAVPPLEANTPGPAIVLSAGNALLSASPASTQVSSSDADCKWTETVSAVSGIIVALAAIIGLVGLMQWRIELRARTNLQIARNMISLAYRFSREFKQARNSLLVDTESMQRQHSDNESPEETRILDERSVRIEKLESLKATFDELYGAGSEAELVFDNILELLQLLEKHYINLRIYTEGLFEGLLKRSRGEDTAPEAVTRLTLGAADKIVRGSEDDEISQEIDAKINELVKRLKTRLKWLRS